MVHIYIQKDIPKKYTFLYIPKSENVVSPTVSEELRILLQNLPAYTHIHIHTPSFFKTREYYLQRISNVSSST